MQPVIKNIDPYIVNGNDEFLIYLSSKLDEQGGSYIDNTLTIYNVTLNNVSFGDISVKEWILNNRQDSDDDIALIIDGTSKVEKSKK